MRNKNHCGNGPQAGQRLFRATLLRGSFDKPVEFPPRARWDTKTALRWASQTNGNTKSLYTGCTDLIVKCGGRRKGGEEDETAHPHEGVNACKLNSSPLERDSRSRKHQHTCALCLRNMYGVCPQTTLSSSPIFYPVFAFITVLPSTML